MKISFFILDIIWVTLCQEYRGFFCSFINCGIWDFLTWDGYMYFLGNKWSLSSPEDSLWKYPFMNINCWVIAYRLWIPVLFPIIFFSFTKTVYMSHSPFPLSRGSLSFSVRMKDLKYLRTHILASSSFLRPRVSQHLSHFLLGFVSVFFHCCFIELLSTTFLPL